MLVVLLTTGLACRSEPAAAPPAKAEAHAVPDPSASTKTSDGAVEADPKPVAIDPERADKLADLDAMCKALDHDYVDGTLTDYYREIQPKTAWGKAQREAGDASIQPGRLLEKAVAELSPGAEDPALTKLSQAPGLPRRRRMTRD